MRFIEMNKLEGSNNYKVWKVKIHFALKKEKLWDTLNKKRLQRAKGVEGAQVVNPNTIQLERSPRQGNGHTCHEY
jgi:hypothetical protein